jgi:hypothetical protein
MIFKCKKRFGYTYLCTNDKKMQALLFAYCEGRSALWRMFLGWRKTTKDDRMFFWIPSRKIDELLEIAEMAEFF